MKKTLTAAMIVAFAAATACAQESLLNDMFDRGGRPINVQAFSEGSVLPVIRETREVPTTQTESLTPAEPKAQPVAGVPVFLDVVVPAAEGEKAIDPLCERLRSSYGFTRDASFAPRRSPEFQILPFPPRPNQTSTFTVRGTLALDRMTDLSRDPAVRAVRVDDSAPKTDEVLQAFLVSAKARILAVPGVVGVAVGVDRPIDEPRYRVLPRKPSLVVTTAPAANPALVRESLLKAVPEISFYPLRLEAASR